MNYPAASCGVIHFFYPSDIYSSRKLKLLSSIRIRILIMKLIFYFDFHLSVYILHHLESLGK